MNITNCFTTLLFAVFVGMVFVLFPDFPPKRHEGDFGQTHDILTPWDEISKREKLEDVE